MSKDNKSVELELVMRSTGELDLEIKKELEQEDKSLASLLDNEEKEEKQDGTT
jgi:hypothetical protein